MASILPTSGTLIDRVKESQDASAWAEFDRIYRPMMRRFARLYGCREPLADEIAQDCMVALARRLKSFKYDPDKGKFRSYVQTVVKRCVLNRLPGLPSEQADTSVLEGVRSRELSPDEEFEQMWRAEHLKYCLGLVKGEVKPETYAAFMAYAIDQQPLAEVCRRFEMTENQVRLIKSRVTRRVEIHFKQLFGNQDPRT